MARTATLTWGLLAVFAGHFKNRYNLLLKIGDLPEFQYVSITKTTQLDGFDKNQELPMYGAIDPVHASCRVPRP